MDIIRQLYLIARTLKVNFTFKGKPISHEEVFSFTGLLPSIAKRADQLASLCFGYGLGISFEDAEQSLTGVKIKFDDVTPNALRYLCVTDVVCELMRAASSLESTPLDELLYD
jgi:intracellular multiplication protein IcmS